MSKIYKWTETELEYLREIAEGKYISEIVELMSKKFNYSFRKTQIKISTSLQLTHICSLLWLSNIPLYICTISSLLSQNTLAANS